MSQIRLDVSRVALRKSFYEKPVVPHLRDLLLEDYGVRCDRLTKN